MLYTINNSPDLSYYSYFVFKYTEGIEAKKVELKISAGGEIYIFLKEKEIALKRVRRWNIIQ